MIQHEGKPLEELNVEETFEFEKVLLRRMQQASIAGMGDHIINQIQFYIELARMHKAELIQREKMGLDDPDQEQNTSLIIGENEFEQSDDTK